MQRSIVRTSQAPAAIGPYSQAVVVPLGDGKRMVFCSGQIPLDPATGNLVEGEVDAIAVVWAHERRRERAMSSSSSSIESVLTEKRSFPPPAEFARQARVPSFVDYEAMYERAAREPETFWGEVASELEWGTPWK